jgi:hypothetical protein
MARVVIFVGCLIKKKRLRAHRRAIQCLDNALNIVPLTALGRQPQLLFNFLFKMASRGASLAVQLERGLLSVGDAIDLLDVSLGAVWTLLRNEQAQAGER